jgi:hypothetical protein
MQLVDDKDELAALDGKLDIVPEAAVPKRVLKKLKRYPRVVWSEPIEDEEEEDEVDRLEPEEV